MVDVLDGIYRAGTVSIESGSDLLLGEGTFWTAVAERLDEVYVAGQRVLIEEIIDDGTFRLAMPWVGDAVEDQPYVLSFRSQLRFDPALVQASVRDLITFYKMGGVRGTREVTDAADPIVVDDRSKAIVYNRATAIAATIPQAEANAQFIGGWAVTLKNSGAGTVTITPAVSTINGVASLQLVPGAGAFLWSHEGNYLAMVFSNLDGTDGGSIFVQPAAPGTAYTAGSIWIDSDSAQLDLFTLTGSPLAWVDTGVNLRGSNGIDGASALTVVRAVATANVNIASGLVNGATIDGVVVATSDLVLLAGQAAPAENGVYVVSASGAASRATAFNSYDAHPGRYFSVMEGSAANADTLWRCTSDKGGTLGTTALAVSQFNSGGRATLTGNRNYYVRANLGAATVTIATPGVWTLNAHGLSNDDPFVVSILPSTTVATISAANPAVITMANTFVAGQPIKLSTTGYLGGVLIPGNIVYVLASGLSGSSFQVSTTPGGTAINTTALSSSFTSGSSTITTGAAHNAVVGQLIRFAGSVATNFSAGTDYYVLSTPTATMLTVAATNGGTAISAGSTVSGGTIVQTGTHYVEKTGALPTGATEGTVYYARNVTANTFEFAAAAGGASIATSGTQAGTFNIATGNNNNNGLAATRAGAFLTPQKAIDTIAALDLSIYNATAILADGVYTTGINASGPWVGSGRVTVSGNTATPSNVIVSTPSSNPVTADNGCVLTVQGFEIRCPTAGRGLFAQNNAMLTIGASMRFGACGNFHIFAYAGGSILGRSNYQIVGAAPNHIFSGVTGKVDIAGITITMTGTLTYSQFTIADSASYQGLSANTFIGSATGQRHYSIAGGGIYVGGVGENYLPGNTTGYVGSPGWYA